MKARLVPIMLHSGQQEKFAVILEKLKEIYAEEAEFLPAIRQGEVPPPEADALLFPNMEVDIYQDNLAQYRHLPMLVMTTVHGVSLMFDWESVAYLQRKGYEVYHPYSVELAKTMLKALALKRTMHGSKFLMFHDTNGDGLIPEQFKIFYWWNEECKADIREKFGITIVQRSFKELGASARAIPDDAARTEAKRWNIPMENITERRLLASIKLFLALRDAVDEEGGVVACGINCLNEAYDSDTTPCLAYDLLYRDRGIMWGCESDTSALLTQYLLGATIDSGLFTTNIYPFLSGMPALSHEKIQSFPDVPDPDDHALLVHCGYLGCAMSQKHATRWMLRPPVLDWLVGEHGNAIDAEIATGDITLAKLHADYKSLQMQKAVLEQYVQYPGSDCRNGGLIRVADGHRMMDKIASHHVIVVSGKRSAQFRAVASIFGLDVDEI